MIRLAIVALGAFALSQTPAVEGIAADVRDFRERQFLTGKRIGCEMQMAQAAIDSDPEGYARLTKECAALRLQHQQL